MSNFNFDVRNEFSTSKLVKMDFLNPEKAQQIKVYMITSFCEGSHLGLHIATLWLSSKMIKFDLGSLVQETIIKLKGLNRISRVHSQV